MSAAKRPGGPGVLVGTLVACALGLAAPPLAAHHGQEQAAKRSAERWPVDAFALTDQHGRPFTQDQLQGRWTFVMFGDLRCGEPCSAGLSAAAAVLQRIARTEAVKTTQLVFVAPGAPRDDAARRLGDYVARFDPRFIAGTAGAPTLQRLADDLGLADKVAASTYPGSLVLVGPDATVRVEYLPPFDVPRLTADFLKTRARN